MKLEMEMEAEMAETGAVEETMQVLTVVALWVF
jgi:hypothetical protein